MASSFTSAWLAGDPRATALLPLDFPDPSRRAAAVDRAAARPITPAVHAALSAQASRWPMSAARAAHLDALARPGTTVVVTGQQVGLFLGPLYTLHKAVAAIVDARALAAETGRPVVPVFWLQTEDADFDEVRSVALPGPDGDAITLTCEDALGPEAARTSLAHRPLGPSVDAVLAELSEHTRGMSGQQELIDLLGRHYRADATWGDAFAGVMAELFAPEGLLLFNPRDPALAALAAPVHTRAIDRVDALSDALVARDVAITEAGCRVQVPVRPGAALSCYHPEGPTGPRYRLIACDDGGGFELSGAEGRVSPDELRAALADDPLRFSTTALLRPVLQDSWLPTAAYVGGPGELAYFAELPPIYAIFGLEMPLAVPRARFRILGPTVGRLCEQLDLTPDDAARPHRELLAELGARRASELDLDVSALEASLRARLDQDIEALDAAAAPLDAGFARISRKARDVIDSQLERVLDRYRRAVAQHDDAVSERLARFVGLLAPDGAPQERTYGMPHFAAQFGPRRLVETLLEAARPFDGGLIDVDP